LSETGGESDLVLRGFDLAAVFGNAIIRDLPKRLKLLVEPDDGCRWSVSWTHLGREEIEMSDANAGRFYGVPDKVHCL
jgi:hypothetical protein